MPEREEAILLRDGYRCTETVHPREAPNGRMVGHSGRCPGMGSDVIAIDGRTLCPHHARLLSTQHPDQEKS